MTRDSARGSGEADELEVRRRVKEMRDEELVDFVRDTIARLDTLADRLEVFVDEADDHGRTRDA